MEQEVSDTPVYKQIATEDEQIQDSMVVNGNIIFDIAFNNYSLCATADTSQQRHIVASPRLRLLLPASPLA